MRQLEGENAGKQYVRKDKEDEGNGDKNTTDFGSKQWFENALASGAKIETQVHTHDSQDARPSTVDLREAGDNARFYLDGADTVLYIVSSQNGTVGTYSVSAGGAIDPTFTNVQYLLNLLHR